MTTTGVILIVLVCALTCVMVYAVLYSSHRHSEERINRLHTDFIELAHGEELPYDVLAAYQAAGKLLRQYDKKIYELYDARLPIIVPSLMFEGLTYHIHWATSMRFQSLSCYAKKQFIGHICIDFRDRFLPAADQILQVVMMIRSGKEEEILIRGNWNSNPDKQPLAELRRRLTWEK